MKSKPKWWVSVLKFIGLTAIGMIAKNQKGIKGTPNEDKIDIVIDEVKENI